MEKLNVQQDAKRKIFRPFYLHVPEGTSLGAAADKLESVPGTLYKFPSRAKAVNAQTFFGGIVLESYESEGANGI